MRNGGGAVEIGDYQYFTNPTRWLIFETT